MIPNTLFFQNESDCNEVADLLKQNGYKVGFEVTFNDGRCTSIKLNYKYEKDTFIIPARDVIIEV